MALFGPRGAAGLAAGFGAQELTAALLAKQLENKKRQDEIQAQQAQRVGQILIEEALQKVMGGSGQIPTNFRPTPTTQLQIGRIPQAPQTRQVGSEGTTFTNAGGTPGAAGPVANGAQALAPLQGTPRPAPQMPQAAPQAPQPQAAASPQGMTWRQVLEEVANRQDAPPGARAAALDMIQKQVDAEMARESTERTKTADREARIQQNIENLKWKYANTASAEERARIGGQIDLEIARLNAASREDVARIGATSREGIAAANNAARERIAQANIGSREFIAANTNLIRQDYQNRLLDMRADELRENTLYRTRVLDLREQGMTNQEAQFYAKLEQDKAVAAARDETTRRGQDMLLQRQEIIRQGKLQDERAQVETQLSGALDDFDAIYRDAERLISHPGMDNATGPIQAWLPTVRGNTANFEAALDSLKAKIGFAALARMRALSPTGGALGNVSNREVEFLQSTIQSLNLRQTAEQFTENLRKIMDYANSGKTKMLEAYQRRYAGNAPAGGAVPAASTTPREGGATIDTPPDVAGEPDGTVFEMDGKTYIKQGLRSVETGS